MEKREKSEAFAVFMRKGSSNYETSYEACLSDKKGLEVACAALGGELFYAGIFEYASSEQRERIVQIIDNFVAKLNAGAALTSQSLERRLEHNL